MQSDGADTAVVLDTLVRSRKSVRAYRPDPVPRHLLEEILETASRAASNFNSQPWRIHLLTGKAKHALSESILQAYNANATPIFSPFPHPMQASYAARVEDFGRRLYSSLGIERTDMPARARQTGRNYTFFDAPVGMILTIDATMTKHSWLDCGLFLQSLLLAAQARGLATCPQVAFVRFQSVIAQQMNLDAEELVACGISCGYADEEAAVNHIDMPRQPLEGFSSWRGFDAQS